MLAFLHSAAVHVDTFDQLANNADPSVPLRHVVREDLFANVLAIGKLTPPIAAAVHAQVLQLVGEGARLVVCTCSTLGRCAETTPVTGRAAVLRVDRPLAERVVATGQRILVAAAPPSAMVAAVELLQDVASQQHRPLAHEELACDAAWPLFLAGAHSGYAKKIAALVESGARSGDQVMLAQASMAPALRLIERRDIDVSASPTVGVAEALAIYRARSPT